MGPVRLLRQYALTIMSFIFTTKCTTTRLIDTLCSDGHRVFRLLLGIWAGGGRASPITLAILLEERPGNRFLLRLDTVLTFICSQMDMSS